MGRIITFSGPSGAGKSTIVDKLLEQPDFTLITSTTTRSPRPSDIARGTHREYEYVSLPDFTRAKDAGAFAWEAHVGSGSYGTKRAYLETAVTAPGYFMLVLVPEVVPTFLDITRHVLLFWVDPESDTILEERMRARGDQPGQIQTRMELSAAWRKLAAQSGFFFYANVQNIGPIEKTVENVLATIRMIGP